MRIDHIVIYSVRLNIEDVQVIYVVYGSQMLEQTYNVIVMCKNKKKKGAP